MQVCIGVSVVCRCCVHCTGACSRVRTGMPYCTPFTVYCTLRGSVCCSVRVMNMHTLRYRCGAGMFLHDKLLEAWSGGHFAFCFLG